MRRAFGLALRAERERRGYSREDWAVEVLEVHPNYAGKVERGKQNLTLQSVERLSARVGIDALVLLNGLQGAADDVPVLRAAHDGDDVDGDLRDVAAEESRALDPTEQAPSTGRTGRDDESLSD